MLWLAAASRRGDVDTTEQVSDAFTQLEEDHLPDKQNSTSDALDEEQRVLLVILSRARHGVIPRSSTQDGGPALPRRPLALVEHARRIRHGEPPGPGPAHERDLPARKCVARCPAGCRPRACVGARSARLAGSVGYCPVCSGGV